MSLFLLFANKAGPCLAGWLSWLTGKLCRGTYSVGALLKGKKIRGKKKQNTKEVRQGKKETKKKLKEC
jgi:hypothetical protein